MDQKFPKPMTPFDSLVTPHHLYLMKLLLPYVPQLSSVCLPAILNSWNFNIHWNTSGFSSSAERPPYSKRPKAYHGPR